ncbi:hypothetical protein QE364_000518 [Nocardioides zeae]|uniref:Uncharacterized protein n=2 Tax=Nocardioides zeae TaxID=1457234 RepID=A0ACC6IE12_9ACTN|nr:HGxxPAAW family protein [Nocardioides zeae]MDQ1104407.1 hypothetical protein [Nocardioides zeae]MDR6175902.1 hypothetical protein [Nocardioides zeae]MDR6208830.1 hypothetical protein [Nocardioides zeae]
MDPGPHGSPDRSNPITEEHTMANNHGNTPAAWTGVSVAMVGFVVGAVGLMLDPISLPVFYVGLALAVGSFFLFLVMAKMGLHEEKH